MHDLGFKATSRHMTTCLGSQVCCCSHQPMGWVGGGGDGMYPGNGYICLVAGFHTADHRSRSSKNESPLGCMLHFAPFFLGQSALICLLLYQALHLSQFFSKRPQPLFQVGLVSCSCPCRCRATFSRITTKLEDQLDCMVVEFNLSFNSAVHDWLKLRSLLLHQILSCFPGTCCFQKLHGDKDWSHSILQTQRHLT